MIKTLVFDSFLCFWFRIIYVSVSILTCLSYPQRSLIQALIIRAVTQCGHHFPSGLQLVHFEFSLFCARKRVRFIFRNHTFFALYQITVWANLFSKITINGLYPLFWKVFTTRKNEIHCFFSNFQSIESLIILQRIFPFIYNFCS